MAYVSQEKKDTVATFAKLISQYDYVGAVNMENLPAKELNTMREKLRDTVCIKMTKRRLINVALQEAEQNKQGITQLADHLKGMPALLFTNNSPFTLFKKLKKNKSKTPIKAGQTAPNDIVIPAGPTSFAPGPIIGELGSVGAKAGIDGGKVVIKEDSVVAKEGDIIDEKLAGILSRLEIKPMEIGLDLTAVYEDGEILTKAVLDIDEDAYINDVTTASTWAFNLAVESAYPCAQTVDTLIANAFTQSKNLAINEDILTDLTVGDTLVKAQNQLLGLVAQLPQEALSEELTQAANAVQQTPQDDKKDNNDSEENKSSEEKKEEPKADAAEGLGALFG